MPDSKSDYSQKLVELFETRRKPNGTRFTQNDVIAGAGDIITRVYLWKLRTGRASNPSFQVIQAIAQVFGVDPNYFFEDTRNSKILVEPPRSKFIEQLVLRADEMENLDEADQETILQMIDVILKTKSKRKGKK